MSLSIKQLGLCILNMKLSYSIFFIFLGFLIQSECILNGQQVTRQNLRKYRYQVSIYIHDGETGKKYTCGGGILDERIIITAAHCFADWHKNDIQDIESIRVTAHTLTSRESISQSSIVRKVEKIYVPKEYFGTGFADIAILRLKKDLRLFLNFRKVKALKLPAENYVTLDKEAIVAGYGTYQLGDNGDDHSQDVLRTMKVVVVPKPDYDRDPHTDQRFIKAKPVANELAKGICNGDSGSPLVIKTKNHAGSSREYTVIGITLGNSDDCDDTIKPGTYTRVSNYVTSFINEVLHNQNSNSFVVKHVGDTTTSCFG